MDTFIYRLMYLSAHVFIGSSAHRLIRTLVHLFIGAMGPTVKELVSALHPSDFRLAFTLPSRNRLCNSFGAGFLWTAWRTLRQIEAYNIWRL
jgi:hypothetical protein